MDFIKNARAQGISIGVIKMSLKKRGYDDITINTALDNTKTLTAIRTKVTEEFLPGYNRAADVIDYVISKTKLRGNNKEKQFENAINYLQQDSRIYEDATDIQREMILRELRKRFGKKIKSAPSVKKILGDIKNVKKITMTEKNFILRIIKEQNKGGKATKKSWLAASKVLIAELKSLEGKGVITLPQMKTILSKLLNTNMLNPVSAERFVDYMIKVLGNASYAEDIRFANKNKSKAYKNATTKTGVAETIVPSLKAIFKINPSMIPDSVFKEYMLLIQAFSQTSEVLELPPLKTLEVVIGKVIKAIETEYSLIPDLKDRFDSYENKVLTDAFTINYSETITKMKEDNIINEKEYELMKKYKSSIMERKKKGDAEKQAEAQERREELLEIIGELEIYDADYPLRFERDNIRELNRLIGTKAVDELSLRDLENLLKLIDSINNGIFPPYSITMISKLKAIELGNIGVEEISKAKLSPISHQYAKLKGFITKKTAVLEAIRREPLWYLNSFLGLEGKTLYDAIFGESANALARFRTDLKDIQDQIIKVEDGVRKSFGGKYNDFILSKYKQMVYLIQKEYESNPNSKAVNPAADFLKKTIKRLKKGDTKYTSYDIEMLQSILKDYSVDGDINIDNLWKSFNAAEKESIKTIHSINSSLEELAMITSTLIRGEEFTPLKNYAHLNVLTDEGNVDVMSTDAFIESLNARLSPSTKAKNLIERTGAVSALNFDVYSAVQRGAKFTLMDYHLTTPVKTAKRTLINMENKIDEDEDRTKLELDIINGLTAAFNEVIRNVLINSYTENSLVDEVAEDIKKQGYRAVLAGTGRFIAELVSNMSFVLWAGLTEFSVGLEMNNIIGSNIGRSMMYNLHSKLTNRVYPDNDLSGKMIDTNILIRNDNTRGGKAKGRAAHHLTTLWNNTGKQWKGGVEKVADTLISTPDKIMMRPLWFGTFKTKFKDLTGIDITEEIAEKIANNDEKFFLEFERELRESTEAADALSTFAGATDNDFMGILKGSSNINQSIGLKVFNAFNNFLTRFLIFEYATAREGIKSMVGRGQLSESKGAGLLAAAVTRMMVYTLLTRVIGDLLVDAFSDDDEDQPPHKPLEKQVGQAIMSAVSSLLLGRDFGNATKSVVNLFIEEGNERYLQVLREGDYDKYRDALQYTLNFDNTYGRGGVDIPRFAAENLAGAYTPGIKALILAGKVIGGKKEPEAIARREKERFIRLPLELLGNLGFIPLYKDVRKVVISRIYSDLESQKIKIQEDKTAKEALLQGYDNQSQMKRLNRPLWDKTYGPESEGYNERQAVKEIEKAQKQLERDMRDEELGYPPPPKKKVLKKTKVLKKKKKKVLKKTNW